MMAVCRRLLACVPLDTQQPGAAWRWPAREHPSGPFGDERGRRRPGKSGAGRVAPSVAAAPAQAWVQLWTLGALPPNTSKTGTLAQSQRYGARGRCARPCCRVWSVCWWQRCATTLVYSCFSWHATLAAGMRLHDAGSWHAITRCWQLSWHPTLILFAPAGSWHATFLPVTPCYVCVAAMFQCLCACSWPVIFLCAVRGRFLNLT
jgi:hypothetical protein